MNEHALQIVSGRAKPVYSTQGVQDLPATVPISPALRLIRPRYGGQAIPHIQKRRTEAVSVF